MQVTTSLFAATFLSTVAAGWALLDAGAPPDGPPSQPALQQATIDGRKVDVLVDRGLVSAGDTVHVTLALVEAARERRGDLDVRVALLEQTGSPAMRSMPAPREVKTQLVHLGRTPASLAFVLDGAPAEAGPDPMALAGKTTAYTIVVSPAAGNAVGDAAVPVYAHRPEAYELTVDAPALVKAGQPVAVAVHVKNVSKATLKAIHVGLSSNYVTVSNDVPAIASLAPGEETTVTVRGTAAEITAGTPLMLRAAGWAEYGGTSSGWIKLDPATGALVARGTQAAASPLELVGG